MITQLKLKIYQKYLGDIDRWARYGTKSDFKLMNDEDLSLIDNLLQSLEIIENGLASNSFKDKTLLELKKTCDSEESQDVLKSLIGKFD